MKRLWFAMIVAEFGICQTQLKYNAFLRNDDLQELRLQERLATLNDAIPYLLIRHWMPPYVAMYE
jgi:hypothetical protein